VASQNLVSAVVTTERKTKVLGLVEEIRKDYLLAASSDAMVEALEVYAAVKAGIDRVPGLQAAASEMAQFFKKTKAKTATMA
jgi:hypothetical protein